jgi:hypothetical protein
MSRAAVIIGVNRCGPLPVLRGAVRGAERVADWAENNGFRVIRLLDSQQTPLRAGKIFDTVDELVEPHDLKTLLVYFAGHGVLLAPNCEYWLLAGAGCNPNEAVNVAGSVEAARNSGIGHVIFISDACRSRATDDWQTSVKGTVIFPIGEPRIPRPAVDRLYATLPGSPALELDARTAAGAYDGVFTDCLLEVLNGQVEETIDQFDNPPPPVSVIQCYRAGEHLQKAVPNRLTHFDPRLNQTPDYVQPRELLWPGTCRCNGTCPSTGSAVIRRARPAHSRSTGKGHVRNQNGFQRLGCACATSRNVGAHGCF